MGFHPVRVLDDEVNFRRGEKDCLATVLTTCWDFSVGSPPPDGLARHAGSLGGFAVCEECRTL